MEPHANFRKLLVRDRVLCTTQSPVPGRRRCVIVFMMADALLIFCRSLASLSAPLFKTSTHTECVTVGVVFVASLSLAGNNGRSGKLAFPPPSLFPLSHLNVQASTSLSSSSQSHPSDNAARSSTGSRCQSTSKCFLKLMAFGLAPLALVTRQKFDWSICKSRGQQKHEAGLTEREQEQIVDFLKKSLPSQNCPRPVRKNRLLCTDEERERALSLLFSFVFV